MNVIGEHWMLKVASCVNGRGRKSRKMVVHKLYLLLQDLFSDKERRKKAYSWALDHGKKKDKKKYKKKREEDVAWLDQREKEWEKNGSRVPVDNL